MRYLPLIWKNSLRNRRRSLLTIASVSASLCLLGVLLALYGALFHAEATPSQALRVVVRHRVSLTQSMPASYEERIRQVPGVKQLSAWQWFGGTYKDARDQKNFFARFAVEPAPFLAVRTDFEMPEEQRQAFIRQQTGAIASRALATKFGWNIGERINMIGDIFPVNPELTLVGIFDEPLKEETLYFNRAYLREMMPSSSDRRDQIGAFIILANAPDDVSRISKTVDDMFDNSPAPTKTESEQAFALSFVSFLGNVKVFLFAICGAVTFTILLVTGNTMAMSVRERVREVGVMKTLGFEAPAILGIILGESAIISLLGGVIGLILASGMTSVIRNGPAFVQGVKTLSISPAVALLSLGIALAIGLVSSFIPAWNAARTPILESLRFNG